MIGNQDKIEKKHSTHDYMGQGFHVPISHHSSRLVNCFILHKALQPAWIKVSQTTVHKARKKPGWINRGTKYCMLVRENNAAMITGMRRFFERDQSFHYSLTPKIITEEHVIMTSTDRSIPYFV